MEAPQVAPLSFSNRGGYYSAFNPIVERIFKACTTRIAHAPDDERTILGWACIDEKRGLLHYIYVKEPYRRGGIARALLDPYPLVRTATHWTKAAEVLGPKFGFAYRPSLVNLNAKEMYRDPDQTRPAA